ncbi:MAG: acyl-CoA hydrolase [Planctomycetota bacterium]|jgi:acyl-CoA hydrolase
MSWRSRFAEKQLSSDQAVLKIKPGKHIQISSGASVPKALVDALGRNASHFADNTIVHLMTFGEAPHVNPEFEGHFRHNAFFIGANVRQAVHEGRADYTPVFLSRIPNLIRTRRMPVDVALIQCSPPDEFGYVNLGVSVDIALAGIDAAELVIAEINPQVPVVHGAGYVAMDQFDYWIEHDAPLLAHSAKEPDDVSLEIGKHVASLIENGSTLQLGIGAIPDAVLLSLFDKRDLGLWTEMFSDGVLPLIKAGVINGKFKTVHPGRITSSFTFGSQELYDFVNNNPLFTFHPSDYVNDPIRISQQHQMVSVNSALEVDLTGQVCADSIGTKFFSGIGGQVDFVRGSAMCEGGRPIIALPSTAKGGTVSRISATLTEGAGVVTSRGDVRFVVTEYGVVDLLGKSIRERADLLVGIAHPKFRHELMDAAKKRHYVFAQSREPRGLYPFELERKINATTGETALLRVQKPGDSSKLQDLIYQVAPHVWNKRFHDVLKKAPHDLVFRLVDVDYDDGDLSLVLEYGIGKQESKIIAAAQYISDPASSLAEVVFVCDEAWCEKGLRSQLFGALVDVAKNMGVRGFTAEVPLAYRDLLQVFQSAGHEVTSSTVGEFIQLKMPFRIERN